MKRTSLFVIAFFILLNMVIDTIPVSAAEAPEFRDVADNSWYASAVQTVCDAGLMIGKGDGIFDPDGQVTGAEAVTIAARIHSILTTGSTDAADHYQESTDEPWYWTYVTYAARYLNQEVLGVYDVPASRRLYARLLAAAVGDVLEEINEVAKNAIPDLEENLLSEGIYRLYRTGILIGNDEKGTFLPDANIRRSEAAAIDARILDPALRKSVTLTEAAYRFDTTFIVPGGWFTLTVPDWWEGEVLMWPCENGEDVFRLDFYCRLEVERTKFGGLLGSIGIRPHKDDRIWQWPVIEIATVTYPDGQTYDVTLHFPSDVQYYLPEPADYERASNSLRSVAAAIQFPEGCEVLFHAPTITEHPKSISIDAGQLATFTVKAQGENLKYQWYLLPSNGANWGEVYENGNADTLTLKADEKYNGYSFDCLVYNDFGSARSSAAVLTVNCGD